MSKNKFPKILIVDDIKANLFAMEMQLESLPLKVIRAYSGKEALIHILEDNIAAVLLDVHMPGMDGFETAERMRSNKETAHIPIIFVTAIFKERKHVFEGYEAGAVDYIFKPVDSEILKNKIKIFLELHNQKKEIERTNSNLLKLNIQLEKTNKKIVLQQEKKIEEERIKVLLNMAGATAHELNQPLMVLLGNIDILDFYDNLDLPDEVSEILDNIKQAAERISVVTKKIQTIRHYEIKPHDEKTDIVKLDQDIHILFIGNSKKHFLKIQTDLESKKDIRLFHATSIEESWAMINKNGISRTDLIFLDSILDGGTRFKFLAELVKTDLQIPVVIITDKEDDAVAEKLIQAGAMDHLPESKISRRALSRIISNAMENAGLKKNLKLIQKKLVLTAKRDPLSGLHNHKYFMKSLDLEVKRAKRYKATFSLLLIDIDCFKKINYAHGYSAGDAVIAGIARILLENIRQNDIAGRIGGDKFGVVLVHNNSAGGLATAERIRDRVEKARFSDKNNNIKVTVSIGITLYSELDSTLEMIKSAEKALSRARKKGLNYIMQG